MHFSRPQQVLVVLVVLAIIALAVGAYVSRQRGYLLLATTTSTRDTGLLTYLLPSFTADTNIEIVYVAVGTGRALDLGRRGDADVVMVHAPALEDAFMTEGHGACLNPVMYNRFVIVGPIADPAGVGTAPSAAGALGRIAANNSRFESRSDGSGTYTKELEIWEAAGLDPAAFLAWYEETDQGMGNTLSIANQLDAYTLSDDGTWYALEDNLPHLRLLYASDEPILRNPYSVIPVNPATHPGVAFDKAVTFARWLVAPRAQGIIGTYEVNGHTIFTPDGAGVC